MRIFRRSAGRRQHHQSAGALSGGQLERLEPREVPAVNAVYAITQNWGTGFEGQVQLANDGSTAVPFNPDIS